MTVTPFVGVWIETTGTREYGEHLKVTPFVGVWIETTTTTNSMPATCHTLRGCVD